MCIQKKIGNILTKNPIEKVEYFNIVDDISKINNTEPTLIIGWEMAKALFPNANILDWEVNNKIFWTFSKRKRRSRYESDIEKFKTFVINDIINSYEYIFMDILTLSCDEKQLFLYKLNDDNKKVCVLKDDMIFIKYTDKIYGVSLKDIDYKGDDRKKFLNILYSNPSISVVSKINLPYEILSKIRTVQYILPCFFD